MICTCGLPMACKNSRQDDGQRRVRLYRCRCGAELGTVELPLGLPQAKRALCLLDKQRRMRRKEAEGESICQGQS